MLLTVDDDCAAIASVKGDECPKRIQRFSGFNIAFGKNYLQDCRNENVMAVISHLIATENLWLNVLIVLLRFGLNAGQSLSYVFKINRS